MLVVAGAVGVGAGSAGVAGDVVVVVVVVSGARVCAPVGPLGRLWPSGQPALKLDSQRPHSQRTAKTRAKARA